MFYVSCSGNITTSRPLDREVAAMLDVPVVATDGAGRSDFCTVRLTILDVNDNAPKFRFPEYHTCIPANLSIESVFLKVSKAGVTFENYTFTL